MDEQKHALTLTGPAKVNGIHEPAGRTVTVSATLALQLAASGAINPDLAAQLSEALDLSDTLLESDFQEAVEEAAAGRIELLGVEHMLEIATLENQLFDLSKELAESSTAVATSLSGLNEARQRVTELENQIEQAPSITTLTTDLANAVNRAVTAETAAAEISGDLATEKAARAEAERKLAEATAPKPAKTAK
ncbi:hypothetical protein [Agrobacterium rosae]|uniref:hypothetical protein n=1 Tax=Agrobacterium rosae TaxID=1972867 RepID=UPI002033F42B|nr:hypothetical protein [Agrobacterium rosae]MCM2431959.1 hypothetical protein [Agrobacterium rosae]